MRTKNMLKIKALFCNKMHRKLTNDFFTGFSKMKQNRMSMEE